MANTNRPIRILQCVSNMDRAGIETMLMNFYRNIDRNEVQFDFLCNKSKPGDYDDEIRELGGNIYVSPGFNPLKWFKYQKFMKELFKSHPEYKIIHCQNEAMGFPALYAAKKANIPVRIAHSHNTTTRCDFKWPIKILYKYLLRLVSTERVACGVDAGKYLFGSEVKVIHNAIDTNRFKFNKKIRDEIRSKYGIEDKFVIGHVGRFEPQKNHEFVIRMFNEYQKVNDQTILLLIGTGSLDTKIRKLVSKLNLDNKVIFTGSISNVNEMYSAMDIFILPSFHEGLPVVGVEAQTAGLPCIFSTNVTQEIKCNQNVEFVSLRNYAQWINAIEKYKNYVREDMSKNILSNGYDIKEETKDLKRYYISLIKNK